MTVAQQAIALNLGCGSRHKASTADVRWINVDQAEPADVVGSLVDVLPTYDAGSVTRIEADNVFEHLDNATFLFVMNECHRLLGADGVLWIVVPDTLRWPDGSFGDPTHQRYFVDRSFEYFTETPLWGTYGSAYGFKCWRQVSLTTNGQFFEWIGAPCR